MWTTASTRSRRKWSVAPPKVAALPKLLPLQRLSPLGNCLPSKSGLSPLQKWPIAPPKVVCGPFKSCRLFKSGRRTRSSSCLPQTFFFFVNPDTGPRRPSRLQLSDTTSLPVLNSKLTSLSAVKLSRPLATTSLSALNTSPPRSPDPRLQQACA